MKSVACPKQLLQLLRQRALQLCFVMTHSAVIFFFFDFLYGRLTRWALYEHKISRLVFEEDT